MQHTRSVSISVQLTVEFSAHFGHSTPFSCVCSFPEQMMWIAVKQCLTLQAHNIHDTHFETKGLGKYLFPKMMEKGKRGHNIMEH